jgi:hypothetical protein
MQGNVFNFMRNIKQAIEKLDVVIHEINDISNK